MVEALLAVILMAALFMAGVRRIKLLQYGFVAQSFALACVCAYFGYKTGQFNYYILGMVTAVAKVIAIPYIMNKTAKDLKGDRETELIINGIYSYIISIIAIVITYYYLRDFHSIFLKAGIVLMISGAMLIIGRKKAMTQMIGFLTMENGLVLFEISMIEVSLIIDIGIIFEVLILALIMSIMVAHINKTFNTTNTDYLANLKE